MLLLPQVMVAVDKIINLIDTNGVYVYTGNHISTAGENIAAAIAMPILVSIGVINANVFDAIEYTYN